MIGDTIYDKSAGKQLMELALEGDEMAHVWSLGYGHNEHMRFYVPCPDDRNVRTGLEDYAHYMGNPYLKTRPRSGESRADYKKRRINQARRQLLMTGRVCLEVVDEEYTRSESFKSFKEAVADVPGDVFVGTFENEAGTHITFYYPSTLSPVILLDTLQKAARRGEGIYDV